MLGNVHVAGPQTLGHVASTSFITLAQWKSRRPPNGITYIEQIIDALQQSNEDVSIYEIEWSVLLNSRSLVDGGAPLITPPSWVTTHKESWTSQQFRVDGVLRDVNCGAFALARIYHKNDRNAKAYRLQQTLGWGEYITPAQLGQAMNQPDFAAWRIIIYSTTGARNFSGQMYSGPDYEFDAEYPKRNLLYILYCPKLKHYGLGRPGLILASRGIEKFTNADICPRCAWVFNAKYPCACDEPRPRTEPKKRKITPKACAKCGSYTGCECRIPAPCCRGTKIPGLPHRCILLAPDKTEEFSEEWGLGEAEGEIENAEEFFAEANAALSAKCNYRLWAYDLETYQKVISVKECQTFAEDDDGEFSLGPEGKFQMRTIAHTRHQVNLIVCRSVFGEEEYTFEGDTALDAFLAFATTINRGRNIFFAHNGSGYDSRLMLDRALEAFDVNATMKVMGTGTKIMELSICQARFRDTMLHFAGSLDRLAKDFKLAAEGIEIKKGKFPHMFNTPDHFDYIGPLPGLEFYDAKFSVKSEKEREEFLAWHAAESIAKPYWNFAEEYLEYCRNDVLILAMMMRAHHEAMVAMFGLSPWFSITTAANARKLLLKNACTPERLRLPPPAEEEAYARRVKEIAFKEGLAVLNDNEYWFARKALRGGRVDVRHVERTLTDHEISRGWKIR